MTAEAEPAKDLFALVADLDLMNAVGALLARSSDLDIRDISFHIERHKGRDSGCRAFAVRHLRPHFHRYRRALVVFDRHGSGVHAPREEIQEHLETDLARNGWPDGRAKVIVIEPELEAWMWAGSSRVSRALGWGPGYGAMRRWLEARGYWKPGEPKPTDPKTAMHAVLRHRRTKWTSPLFAELAAGVDLSRCGDAAFSELRDTLRSWFPPTSSGPAPEKGRAAADPRGAEDTVAAGCSRGNAVSRTARWLAGGGMHVRWPPRATLSSVGSEAVDARQPTCATM